MDGPWLEGYALRGPGSLRAAEPIRVGPLRRLNFLVGRNNHGKSTLMRGAAYWLGRGGTVEPDYAFETLLRVTNRVLGDIYRRCSQDPTSSIQAGMDRGAFVQLAEDQIGVWVAVKENPSTVSDSAFRDALRLSNYRFSIPPDVGQRAFPTGSITIPAFREMRPAPDPSKPRIETGEGLIKQLQDWERPENPGSTKYKKAQERWERMRLFITDVLEDEGAALEVAANGRDLHVRLSQYGDMLNINDLGDGVKQVVMIAAACVHYDNHFICLEEPEIHLHAGLQRKLMRFLSEHTDNQYLIATHSAHVLDAPDAGVFHVVHDGESTTVTSSMNSSDVRGICTDLGYLASDILQANYTIWVEGPSDRVYWRHWLSLIDQELEEGVHYSMMVYGGRLIDNVHLRGEDAVEDEDLIQLVRLGRACTVIIDSDFENAHGELLSTARRLLSESVEQAEAAVIVPTWGRTVENLFDHDLLRQAVVQLHPVAGPRMHKNLGAFDQPFKGMKSGSFSKTAVARKVVESFKATDLGDELRESVAELADRIRRANGLDARQA